MTKERNSPIKISKEEFKQNGYALVDQIGEFIYSLQEKQVTTNKSLKELRELLGNSSLPREGTNMDELLSKSAELLFENSLFNAHPKFLGFITSSPTPIGMLADLLSASINSNVSAQILSPISTEIEKQTISWLAEFIGVSNSYGGLLVSGGNMANFTAFLTARTKKGPSNIKEKGLNNSSSKMITYCSESTHTWVDKAAILFGHGLSATRRIATDKLNKIDLIELEKSIKKDIQEGHQPFLVVATAGDVSTGSVDNLKEIAKICTSYNLWFHVDGAYGAPANVLPELNQLFDGITEADSIAFDPHKWLYTPLEAGCVLIKNPQDLVETYSRRPEYYSFAKNEEGSDHNFYELGFQNSRGFRALKVWLTLQHAGKDGFIEMIRADIELSKLLFDLAEKHPELEAISHNLSITSLRFIPETGLDNLYLNELNEKLLYEIQKCGELFLSNAIINDNYCLRACVVNFNTTEKDIKEVVEIIVRLGRKIHSKLPKK